MGSGPFGMAPQKKSPGIFGYPADTGATVNRISPPAPRKPLGGAPPAKMKLPSGPFTPAPFTPMANVPNENAMPYNYSSPTMTMLGMRDTMPAAPNPVTPPGGTLGSIFGGNGGGGFMRRPILGVM